MLAHSLLEMSLWRPQMASLVQANVKMFEELQLYRTSESSEQKINKLVSLASCGMAACLSARPVPTTLCIRISVNMLSMAMIQLTENKRPSCAFPNVL